MVYTPIDTLIPHSDSQAHRTHRPRTSDETLNTARPPDLAAPAEKNERIAHSSKP